MNPKGRVSKGVKLYCTVICNREGVKKNSIFFDPPRAKKRSNNIFFFLVQLVDCGGGGLSPGACSLDSEVFFYVLL